MKVLVIGSGGREHCIAWKLSKSPLVDKVFCAPGNGGTSLCAENIPIKPTDIKSLLEFAKKNNIGLTVVGPEVSLVAGVADAFRTEGLVIFGPDKELAQLEGSKILAKKFMRDCGIPTADFEVFDDAHKAKEYIAERAGKVVVKADGLAAGKGVIVCDNEQEAFDAVDTILIDKKFGDAGNKLLVEACLIGEEVSMLAFVDGETFVPLVSSQDHKRIFDNDQGPNTGGMGAYSPAPIMTDRMKTRVNNEIFKPFVNGLKKQGKKYHGVIYAGLMIVNGDPYVLEFNVRFGDPETQALLPKLKNDLADIMLKVCNGKLHDTQLVWDERVYVCVVLASGGYPGSYEKGKQIDGITKNEDNGYSIVFHAGTVTDGVNFFTDGGRVLNVVGMGETVKDAQNAVYSRIAGLSFENMFYRQDIANKALNR
ncbi:MAG: phosphoribosylamine--glycine ligase [Candidatus Omnitrophica bacterium]|nr:phosphoribosylamine--glycine ligase [Candidatus Omnitrophota bacterium]MDD5441379.1 phosphoribosylamine--glycine ligase [Candidatus Omnitrophota bacterium]